MALFKNGELIKLDGVSPEAKDYQVQKKWIKDNIGFPVVFKRKQTWITTEIKNDGEPTQYAPPFIIPNVSTVVTEDGRDEWRWCPIVPKKKDGEYEFPRQFRTSSYDKITFALQETEMDKIYYLMYKDGNFKSYYEVDDPKSDANAQLEKRIKEQKLSGIFYNKNSVLLQDDAKLRQIARAWNVAHIERMNNAQIILALEARVREEDAKGIRTIDEFLDATQLDTYTEVAAIVQKAEDEGIIEYEGQSSMWFYKSYDGSYGEKLCQVSKKERDHKYDVLRNFLFTEPDHIARLRSLVDVQDKNAGLKLNFDDLENEDYEKVRMYCNLHNITLTKKGRSKEDVLADVRAHAKR